MIAFTHLARRLSCGGKALSLAQPLPVLPLSNQASAGHVLAIARGGGASVRAVAYLILGVGFAA